MAALTKQARETIKGYKLYNPQISIAGYIRHHFTDGKWHGDVCGCPDDRCANGFHHDGENDCGCLPVCVEHYIEETRER